MLFEQHCSALEQQQSSSSIRSQHPLAAARSGPLRQNGLPELAHNCGRQSSQGRPAGQTHYQGAIHMAQWDDLPRELRNKIMSERRKKRALAHVSLS